MKKTSLFLFAITLSFCAGFALNGIITKGHTESSKGRVTGIGGIFFKCKDPKKMRAWYSSNLGLQTNQYGSVFEWWQGADSTQKGFTQWSPFAQKTTYFGDSTQQFMVNYRVDNLDALMNEFKKNGVSIVDTVESVEYGKFVHILDVEGNKVELWEPNDVEFEKLGKQMGATTTK